MGGGGVDNRFEFDLKVYEFIIYFSINLNFVGKLVGIRIEVWCGIGW